MTASTTSCEPTTVASGFRLPESLRWHDGEIWMSDMDGGVVYRIGPNGREPVCEVAAQPSGLGWDREGRLLIVSQLDARLLCLDGTTLTTVADLTSLLKPNGGDVRPNDMYVDADGTAYIGSVSFQVSEGRLIGDDNFPTPVVSVTADGVAKVFNAELRGPNGMARSLSGDRLVVAETRANRLVSLDLDGRVVHSVSCVGAPDGVSSDASGAIWVAFPFAAVVQRLGADGTVLQQIETPGRVPLDCEVGGSDGELLYVASVEMIDHLGSSRTGRVDVYGIGSS